MMTHMMRSMTEGDMANRAYRTTQLFLLTTIAGAALVQMQSLIAGKDANDMSDPRFWGEASLRGGGLGLLRDLVYSTKMLGGEGITDLAKGPGPTAAIDLIGDLGPEAYYRTRRLLGVREDRSPPLSGPDLAQHMKAWTPGSSLWYSKLATDRLVFDGIQSMIDPDYRSSFSRYERRMKTDFGHTFWWAPGDSAPERGPNAP